MSSLANVWPFSSTSLLFKEILTVPMLTGNRDVAEGLAQVEEKMRRSAVGASGSHRPAKAQASHENRI